MRLLAPTLLLAVLTIGRSELITEYEWKYFDYEWLSPEHEQSYLDRGLYNPQLMTPIDVDRSMDKRIFITIVGGTAVPASLNTLSLSNSHSNPLLKPYPDWSWYENFDDERSCDEIINSVYRVAIDECNRLWVLDNGVIDGNHTCPAKILVFDLLTNKLLLQEIIPDHVAQNRMGAGLLVTPIVETHGDECSNTTLYMADVQGNALVIWSNHKTVRLEAKVFRPEERNSRFTIAEQSFDLADGVLGMALTPKVCPTCDIMTSKRTCPVEEERYLYFRPLASLSMYGADTEALRGSFHSSKVQYFGGVDVLPSQASAQAFSSDGVLFYGLTGQTAIGCWNFRKPMVPRYFGVALEDRNRLQFISGMKIIKSSYYKKTEEYLLMLTNRYQKIATNTLDIQQVNFRILTAPVKSLIKGTICDTKDYCL